MSILEDGLGLGNWIVKRIDQAASWITGGLRRAEVKRINDAIDRHDSDAVDAIVRDIEKKRTDRTEAS